MLSEARNLELSDWQDCTHLSFFNTGIIHADVAWHKCWGIELISLDFHGKHFTQVFICPALKEICEI